MELKFEPRTNDLLLLLEKIEKLSKEVCVYENDLSHFHTFRVCVMEYFSKTDFIDEIIVESPEIDVLRQYLIYIGDKAYLSIEKAYLTGYYIFDRDLDRKLRHYLTYILDDIEYRNGPFDYDIIRKLILKQILYENGRRDVLVEWMALKKKNL